jgi:hypothetical protein
MKIYDMLPKAKMKSYKYRPMVDNDASSKISVGSFNTLLTSGTELNFQKIAK